MAKTSEGGTPELEAISEQFRHSADRLGLSQNQVARLSGVSRKRVGVAFAGGNISVSVLVKLIRALKIHSLDLSDVTLRAERNAVNSRLIEHARTLLDRAAADVRDAAELLRERRLGDRARRAAGESRRPQKQRER